MGQDSWPTAFSPEHKATFSAMYWLQAPVTVTLTLNLLSGHVDMLGKGGCSEREDPIYFWMSYTLSTKCSFLLAVGKNLHSEWINSFLTFLIKCALLWILQACLVQRLCNSQAVIGSEGISPIPLRFPGLGEILSNWVKILGHLGWRKGGEKHKNMQIHLQAKQIEYDIALEEQHAHSFER